MNARQKLILGHVKVTAMNFGAWRGPLDRLVALIVHASKGVLSPDEIERFVKQEAIQRELQAHWAVGLWRSSDPAKSWRLVDQELPGDLMFAEERLNNHPPSSDCCRWCWQDERGQAMYELVAELDPYGEPVPASRLHPNCLDAWKKLRSMVERRKGKVS